MKKIIHIKKYIRVKEIYLIISIGRKVIKLIKINIRHNFLYLTDNFLISSVLIISEGKVTPKIILLFGVEAVEKVAKAQITNITYMNEKIILINKIITPLVFSC
jgi:hypothetical protein